MTGASPLGATACRRAADLLLAARRTRRPIHALPDDCRPRTLDDAYAIQAAGFDAAGGTLAGFKIGATGQKARAASGLDGPFYGRVARGGLLASPAEIVADRLIFRLVEPEFAVRLGADLPARAAPYGRHEAAAAVAAVYPAFEVVTSAYGPAWTEAGALALTADNRAHAALVLGPACTSWRRLDLAAHPVILRRDGREEGRGQGANALGHPLDALAWLAGQGVCAGRGLMAGDVVATGAVTPAVHCEAGDAACADFAALGEVRVRFTD